MCVTRLFVSHNDQFTNHLSHRYFDRGSSSTQKSRVETTLVTVKSLETKKISHPTVSSVSASSSLMILFTCQLSSASFKSKIVVRNLRLVIVLPPYPTSARLLKLRKQGLSVNVKSMYCHVLVKPNCVVIYYVLSLCSSCPQSFYPFFLTHTLTSV